MFQNQIKAADVREQSAAIVSDSSIDWRKLNNMETKCDEKLSAGLELTRHFWLIKSQ